MQLAIVIREALADAITGNFWISVGVIGVILVAMLQLKELKLRGADQLSGAGEIEPAAGDPDATSMSASPAPAKASAASATAPSIAAPGLATVPAPAPGDAALWSRVPAREFAPGGAGSAPAGSMPAVRRLLDTRMPQLPLSRRRRVEVLGALTLGSLIGLAASVSVRGGNGNGRAKSGRRQEVSRDGKMAALRRRGANLLDPSLPEPPLERRRFF